MDNTSSRQGKFQLLFSPPRTPNETWDGSLTQEPSQGGGIRSPHPFNLQSARSSPNRQKKKDHMQASW